MNAEIERLAELGRWLEAEIERLAELGRWLEALTEAVTGGKVEVMDYEKIFYPAGLALARMAYEVNAEESTLDIDGLYDKATNQPMGDWQITVRRKKAKS